MLCYVWTNRRHTGVVELVHIRDKIAELVQSWQKGMTEKQGGPWPMLYWIVTVSEPFWAHFGAVLEPCRGRVGTVSKPLRKRTEFWNRLRTVSNRFPSVCSSK